jgi:hypothetical protein
LLNAAPPREIDVFINSGISFVVRNSISGEICGGAFNCYFARNDNCDVIEGASMGDWYNAAAEIAMEVKPEKPQLIWRDYQYQGHDLLKLTEPQIFALFQYC